MSGLAGALSIGLTLAFLFVSGHAVALSWRGFAASGDVLAQIGVAATLEELMFRALLFRILEERAGTRWALVVSALVFGVAHAANGGFSAISLVSVPLCGLLWTGVYVLSRNVWVASAHHACWNSAIFLSGLPLSGQEGWRAQAPLVSRYQGADLWSGGAFGPEDSLVNVVVCVLLGVLLWRLAARSDAAFPRSDVA